MPKIVINAYFGGFCISKEAAEYMAQRGHAQAAAELADEDEDHWYGYGYSEAFPDGYKRDDPALVEAVEALGAKANGRMSNLRVVHVPDGIDWYIDEYDGREHVAERHRTWS